MIHVAAHFRAQRGPSTARLALSLLFVCLITAVAHNSFLFPQINAQELQNNGSVTSSEEAQNSDYVVEEKTNDFEPVRLQRRGELPVALETAIVRYTGEYQGADGSVRQVNVDLIGAIHMAEQPYYDEINKLFTQYNTVVFELVTDSDADVALLVQQSRNKDKKKDSISLNPLNFVSILQEGAARLFRLSYQIDGVDYAAPNLRRGDCSSAELIVETIKSGDFLDLFLTAAISELAPANAEGELASIVAILCAKDRRLVGKRFFAKELADTTLDDFRGAALAVEDESKESDASKNEALLACHENAIIHFRNKKALAVLRQELDAGRTNVALFFGAAHLPDLGYRLETDFGLQRDPELRWLKAWSLE